MREGWMLIPFGGNLGVLGCFFPGGSGHLCCHSATSELVEGNSPLLKKPSTKLRVNSLYPPAATHCLHLWTGPGRKKATSIQYFKTLLVPPLVQRDVLTLQYNYSFQGTWVSLQS